MANQQKRRLDVYSRRGDYLIFDDGRVFSKKSNKFLKFSTTKFGYEQVSLYLNGKLVRKRKHQLVAEEFVPNPEHKPIVNHLDGVKKNCTPENLEWCDYARNNKHARDAGLNNVSKSNHDRWNDPDFRKRTSENISKGLRKSGAMEDEKNPSFKYRILADGKKITKHELAKMLGRSESNISAKIARAAAGETIPEFVDNNVVVVRKSK